MDRGAQAVFGDLERIDPLILGRPALGPGDRGVHEGDELRAVRATHGAGRPDHGRPVVVPLVVMQRERSPIRPPQAVLELQVEREARAILVEDDAAVLEARELGQQLRHELALVVDGGEAPLGDAPCLGVLEGIGQVWVQLIGGLPLADDHGAALRDVVLGADRSSQQRGGGQHGGGAKRETASSPWAHQRGTSSYGRPRLAGEDRGIIPVCGGSGATCTQAQDSRETGHRCPLIMGARRVGGPQGRTALAGATMVAGGYSSSAPSRQLETIQS